MADLTNQATDSVIGKAEDRVDGRLKVTGRARYSAEMPVANLLHAVMIMSTVPNGSIDTMDIDNALSHPGVVAVLTPFNTPKLPSPPSSSDESRPQSRVLSLLQNNRVYYQNQPIGLVVAETLESAQFAATLVKTAYTEFPAATDIDKERVRRYAPKKANRDPTDSLRGSPQSGMASSATTLKQLYTTPYLNHNPMEPHATIAIWDTPDKLTLYDATQGIFGVQGVLATIWQLPPSNVRVLTYFVGGGFGCKGSAWSHVPLATMAAKVTNRPVKLVLSRQQMFGMVGYRPTTEQSIELGADSTGKLLATRHDVYTMTSTFDEFIEPSAVATRMLYSCPNLATTHRVTRLNYGTPTYMRAPGESSGTFAIETAMDELALKLNQDPLALRLTNYAEEDEDKQRPFSSKSLRQCYQVGADRFGWNRRSQVPGSTRTPDGQLVGYGLATATYPTNRSAASAKVSVMPDGTAVFTAGTQDIGTGTWTVMRQIAADAIGFNYDRVNFLLGDTKMPNTPVSGGSQTAASTGSAVLEVGIQAKQKLIQLAIADSNSPVFGHEVNDIDINQGRIFSKSSPTKSEPVAAFLSRQSAPIELTATSAPGSDKDKYSSHSFGAVFTEVHVDPDFGTTRVARVVGVYGVGNRLNAKTARSQLIGGMVFGIGMAMMEETHPDLRNARIVNPDLAEYHVPVNADVPEIDVVFVDEVDYIINPLGIKGIGEIGITGIVGSLGNAIYNATGVRVRSIPFTLDKIMA